MPAIGSYEYRYSTEYKSSFVRFSEINLEAVKKTLREHSNEFDDEIKSYIQSCAEDLMDAGIEFSFFNPQGETWVIDSRILQAVRFYCLSVYGLYNADSEKYDKAYRSLKATLCTQKKYTGEKYAL